MEEIRLNNLMKRFNIGLDTLVDYLNVLGAGIDNATPNTKVSDELLPALQTKFGRDSDLNEASEKVGVRITEILGKSARKSLDLPPETSPPLTTVNPGKNGIRLGKIMKDLDIELDLLVHYLNALGYAVDADPNSKIPRTLFPLILQEYANDFIKTEAPNDDNIIPVNSRVNVPDPFKINLRKALKKKTVAGVVTAIDRQRIIINIGTLPDGVIPASELKYKRDLKIGDEVRVFVDGSKDSKGRPAISHCIVRQLASWDTVYSAFKMGKNISGYVIKRKKGGLLVDLKGFQAFLPGSQIDSKPIQDYDDYIGKWLKFKIIKFDPESRNVIVSHKAVLDPELEARRSEFLSKLKDGQIVEGTVKRITNYGLFVDLGDVDGFIHISELKPNGIINPKETISVGQSVEVVVLNVNEQQRNVHLGLPER